MKIILRNKQTGNTETAYLVEEHSSHYICKSPKGKTLIYSKYLWEVIY